MGKAKNTHRPSLAVEPYGRGFVVVDLADKEFRTIADFRCRSGADYHSAEEYARKLVAVDALLDSCKEHLRVIAALKEANVLGDWPVVRESLTGLRAALALAEPRPEGGE